MITNPFFETIFKSFFPLYFFLHIYFKHNSVMVVVTDSKLYRYMAMWRSADCKNHNSDFSIFFKMYRAIMSPLVLWSITQY